MQSPAPARLESVTTKGKVSPWLAGEVMISFSIRVARTFFFNAGWFLCQCMSREEMARRRAEDATEGLLHTADQMDTLPQR